jgi:hypothetical protein
MINLTDNFNLNKPAHLDARVGPWASVEDAKANVPFDKREIGLTLVVDDGSGAVEYWFKEGLTNGDLIAKSTGGGGSFNCSDLSTCEVFTNLETDVAGKFDIPTGTTYQYLDGQGTPTNFSNTGQAGTLIREVRNESGATLTKGTAVYISGAGGNKAVVTKAIATGDTTSAQTFGIIQADIPNNQNGFVVVRGDLADLDTSMFIEGAQLYLSSTTAGAMTMTKQYAPNHLVYLAIVTRVHVSQGRIEVAIQNGYELDELHDVQAQTPSNRNGLFYNSTTGLWVAREIESDDLPNLDASKITTGTLGNQRMAKISRPMILQSSPSFAGNTTSEVILQTLTIPANSLVVGDVLRICGFYTYVTAGTKTPRLRFGNTITGLPLMISQTSIGASVTSHQVEFFAVVTTSTTLRFATNSIAGMIVFGNNTGALQSQSIDLTQPISVSFTIQKATGTDTTTLETSWIEILTQ